MTRATLTLGGLLTRHDCDECRGMGFDETRTEYVRSPIHPAYSFWDVTEYCEVCGGSGVLEHVQPLRPAIEARA